MIMANYPRSLIVYDGDLFHVTWKCHNNDWLLSSDFARQVYYDLLLKYKTLYGVHIFSYCFMDNHPHLSGKCESQKLFSDFFRVVNSCFAKTLNKHLKRKGQMVMDRFKSPTIHSDEGLLNVMIYNDLNPSRTIQGMHPRQHKWSSYHHYAYGKKDALLTEPDCYTNMGRTPIERQKNYRSMIDEIFKNDARVPKCPYKENCKSLWFIGDPQLVVGRYEKLKAESQSLRIAWRERHLQFLERIKITA